MALIKCPECQNDVSSSAVSCPHCGYLIKDYAEQAFFTSEVLRLTDKIKPCNFSCPKPRVKVCIKCGRPFYYSTDIDDEKSGTPCLCKCGIGSNRFPGVEVDYPEQQVGASLSSMLYILEECVIPRNIGDQESDEYKAYVSELYKDIKRSENACKERFPDDWQIKPEKPDRRYFGKRARHFDKQPTYTPPPAPPKPKCPICGSDRLSKISTLKKAGKIGLFGIFGAGDIGKTWKCDSCGSKF